MMYEQQQNETEQKLRDFQRATVEYLYRRMYDEGQSRMLVADEVGLGKTWVAKGLVAKAFEKWQQDKNDDKQSFNVFYICSNQQLAIQNLKKLNFTKDERCIASQINRISLLAYKPKHENAVFHIYSLTPDTSFNETSTLGTMEERLILFSILETDNIIKAHIHALEKLMEGTRNLISWHPLSNSEYYRNRLRNNIVEAYIEHIKRIVVDEKTCPKCYALYKLNGKMSLLDFIRNVVTHFNRTTDTAWGIYAETIGSLRHAMTDICLSLMDADIFIMDEFQRYSQLLDTKGESEQATIAQKVFTHNSAKVLMLSATPFKPFTNQIDEKNNEQHYKEFKRVLQFLCENTSIDWQRYEDERSRMFSNMLSLKDATDRDALLTEIQKAKQYVEDVYSRVIVRTEKIIASNDPNAMIVDKANKPLPVTKGEIEDFLHLDAVFRCIYESKNEKAPSPIDYAKSAPYAMSYMRDYKVGEKAKALSLPLARNAFVDLAAVNRYEFPKDGRWPNGKLNILMQNIRKEARLLWCPPSINYYKPEGVFRGQEKFTKTLVFSAWKFVPKMIATLLSYEAEKQSIGKMAKEEKAKYFTDKRTASKGDTARRPFRRLTFAANLKSMTTLLLAYPSRCLEHIIDPLLYINKEKKAEQIVNEHCSALIASISAFCKEKGDEKDKECKHICWAFPMVSDQKYGATWLKGIEKNIEKKRAETILSKDYISELRAILDDKQPKLPMFPKHPTNAELQRQAKQMMKLSLGSPAICAYRALKRYFGDENEVLAASFQIGLSFIDLFNKPESIAVVELQYPQKSLDYWQKVVQYCIDGNIQAMLDEYVFMLLNEYDNSADIANAICSVLSMRTANMKVDDATTFCVDNTEDTNTRHLLRSHYAAAFGINAKSSQGSEIRATNIREAFNSPFRPFVLATTSIGQEGLDFHWYCRRIVHWNLPNNPIDFEQREGRINRYRGKVIRQRVADKYISELSGKDKPWEELFEMAETDKKYARFPCDIVPGWHFDSDGVGIERIVPLYQFSQDIERYTQMLKILGLYRLTFGQPRQEELAKALNNALTQKEAEKLLINLCPLKRENENYNS